MPCVSLLLGAAAVVLHFVPDVAALMQYDTQAVAAGEIWRVATCHATHWSLDHLVWDVGALVVLGALCEVPYRRVFLCSIAAAAMLIPLGVWVFLPEMNTYRGLSGIDSTVFVLLNVMILGESLADRQYGWTAMCTAVLFAFAVKVGYECVTDATVFVDSAAAGMIPIPLAHVVGGFVGLACAVPATLTARKARHPHEAINAGRNHGSTADRQPVRTRPAHAGQ